MSEFVVPQHLAVIMDGNGRWAKQRNLERVEGHIAGAENVRKFMKLMKKYGIKYLTLYAFSTENWKRSKEEVDALMELLSVFLRENLEEMKKEKISLKVTGRLEGLPEKAGKDLENAISETAEFRDHTLILALNYGGRLEIVDAAKKIVRKVMDGKIAPDEINEKIFAENLYLPEIPDPDLMIRTSGEMRLSNFLLWELSYAELYVTDTFWPDFGEEDLIKALKSYASRERRFGGRKS